MRKQQNRVLSVLAVAVFAAHSVACTIQTESIMEMQDGSAITLAAPPLLDVNMPLEGGTVMDIAVSIGLFDLLFGSIDGDVTVSELLFATPPFSVLGVGTEEVCIVPEDGNQGGGTFESAIYGGTATFDITLNTIALIGNPVLAANLPGGGFAFPFDLEETIDMSLGDMLGMLTGAGSMVINQNVDLDVDIDLGGFVLPAHVGGAITLASADAFPSTPLLDSCIAFLNE